MNAKKFLSALLCVVLVLALAAPAMAAPAGKTYTDVADDFWAKNEIQLISDYEIVNGYEDGSFQPNNFITRQAFALIMANYSGWETPADEETMAKFNDLADCTDEMKNAIACCVEAGAMCGYVNEDSTQSIQPTAFITRQAAAKLIATALDIDLDKRDDSNVTFADDANIAAGLIGYVKALANGDIVLGHKDGEYHAWDFITRAQTAAIISRVLPSDTKYGAELKAYAYAKNQVGEDTVVAAASVFNRFDAQAFIPSTTVDSTNLYVNGQLINVAGKTLSRELSFNQEAYDFQINLNKVVPNLYDFQFATLRVNVNGTEIVYNAIAEYNNELEGLVVAAVPANSAKVQAIYKSATEAGLSAIVDAVEGSGLAEGTTTNENGTFAVIANGSYVQFGNKLLSFDAAFKGDLVLDNLQTKDDALALEDLLREALVLTDVEGAANCDLTVVLKAGTKVAYGTYDVVLGKDVTITVTNFDFDYSEYVSQFDFSEGVNTANNRAVLGQFANALLAAADQAVLMVNVTF